MTRLTCLIVVLHFLMPVIALSDSVAFRWEDRPEQEICRLWWGEKPVVDYVYLNKLDTPEEAFDTTKAFHHIYGPQSGACITKGPGGLFPHHRGLYVGWNKTTYQGKSADFWHCRNGEREAHVRFLNLDANDESATMTALIHWTDPEGTVVIAEQRTLVVRPLEIGGSVPAWQIDWTSTLESKVGKVRLTGDRQHAGLQFRASQDVAESNGATYLRPANFPQDPKAIEQFDEKAVPPQHADLGWLAMTYEIDGHRYTVEYFEDPALPNPSRFAERAYGRFGAFVETDIEETPLQLRYRLIVSEGPTPEGSEIDQRYQKFAAELN